MTLQEKINAKKRNVKEAAEVQHHFEDEIRDLKRQIEKLEDDNETLEIKNSEQEIHICEQHELVQE